VGGERHDTVDWDWDTSHPPLSFQFMLFGSKSVIVNMNDVIQTKPKAKL
jgi:hypothetical protein